MANSLGESEAAESPAAAAAAAAAATDKSPLKVVLPVRAASNGGGAEAGDEASWDEDKYQRRLARAKRYARSGRHPSPATKAAGCLAPNMLWPAPCLAVVVSAELATPEDWWRDGSYRSCDHLWQADDQVPRIDYAHVSEADFIERFERPGLPVVIRGATDAWPARERWTLPVRPSGTWRTRGCAVPRHVRNATPR